MGLTHKLEDLMNVPRLTEWLDRNLPELGSAPLEVELVHGGFSNVVVVANYEGIFRVFYDVFDALGPRVEFFLGIEIVVALEARNFGVVGEPRVVSASM